MSSDQNQPVPVNDDLSADEPSVVDPDTSADNTPATDQNSTAPPDEVSGETADQTVAETDTADDTAEEEAEEESEATDDTAEEAAEEDAEAEPEATDDTAEEDAEEEDDDQDDGTGLPVEEAGEEEEDDTPKWYILKVQVNREDSICRSLERRVKMQGLEEDVPEIVVPVEEIAEFNRSGKRRIVRRKLFPGYIMVNMVINDDTWFLVRETPGIGDFTGSVGKPTPMDPHEVERILKTEVDDEDEEGQVKTSIPFKAGDRIRVKDGYFQNFEGDVDEVDEANGRVTVMINIFGRSTPVELEHWQIEDV